MQCCRIKPERSPRRWWRSAGSCAGSGLLLALLPKCPLCIAAYLGLWMGASWAMPLAHTARPLLLTLFAVSLLWVLARIVARRTRI